MAFEKVCALDDLWEGEMFEMKVGPRRVLMLRLDGGDVRAFQAACPHQDIPLSEGQFEDGVVICRAHQWRFDARTGQGINPGDCRLAVYPVQVQGDDVLIDVVGVEPCFAHT
jgi:toluene monooxygenase system ferredoxin subunit